MCANKAILSILLEYKPVKSAVTEYEYKNLQQKKPPLHFLSPMKWAEASIEKRDICGLFQVQM